MISEAEFNSLQPKDMIQIGPTEYTIDKIDKTTNQILSIYYMDCGVKEYTGDSPYTYDGESPIGASINKIIKHKITNWKEVIKNGTKP